jgi:hypothetical protein
MGDDALEEKLHMAALALAHRDGNCVQGSPGPFEVGRRV